MIWSIIKKQGLIFIRNPQQLLLLVGLPIILIIILGASLSGFMNGEAVSIDAKVAMIDNGNNKAEMEQFFQELENSNLPKSNLKAIHSTAEQINPVKMLKNIVNSEELQDLVNVEMVKPSKKEKIMNDESYAAIIEIPDNFTYETLKHIFMNEKMTGTLKIYQNEGETIGSSVVHDIVQQYQDQLTVNTFAEKNGISNEALQVNADSIHADIISVNQKEPVSAKEYYAVGMAVMNVLFLASTIGSFAFLERQTHVFNRVILANVSRWTYFSGIFVSGIVFSFLHLLIVFGFSWAFYDVAWPNVVDFLVITFGVAMAVGGLAVLLTAISYRIKSEQITNFFSNIIVTVMAFLGGSFFPIGDSVKTIQILGNFTPNGAGMTAYLQLLRGDGIAQVTNHLLFLVIFSLALVAIAALSFPKRGQVV